MTKTLKGKVATVTIANKETTLLLTEDTKVTYANLLATIINKPMKEGVTIKEMKRDLALLDKFESAEIDADIVLTKEDMEFIAEQTAEFKWGVRHKDIVEFVEYIDEIS